MVAPAVRGLRERGVLTRGLAGGSLQVSPPLVVDRADLAELADAMGEVLAGLG